MRGALGESLVIRPRRIVFDNSLEKKTLLVKTLLIRDALDVSPEKEAGERRR